MSKTSDFEDYINDALNKADGEMEVAAMVGIMQIKIHVICQRWMKLDQDSGDDGPGPADYWKRIK